MTHWFRKPRRLRGWLAVTAAVGSAALFPIHALAVTSTGAGYAQALINFTPPSSGTPCLPMGTYAMALFVEGHITALTPTPSTWVGSFDTTGTVTVPAAGGCPGPSTVTLPAIPPAVASAPGTTLTCGAFTGTLSQATAGAAATFVLTAACVVNGSTTSVVIGGTLAYSAGVVNLLVPTFYSDIYNGGWTSTGT